MEMDSKCTEAAFLRLEVGTPHYFLTSQRKAFEEDMQTSGAL